MYDCRSNFGGTKRRLCWWNIPNTGDAVRLQMADMTSFVALVSIEFSQLITQREDRSSFFSPCKYQLPTPNRVISFRYAWSWINWMFRWYISSSDNASEQLACMESFSNRCRESVFSCSAKLTSNSWSLWHLHRSSSGLNPGPKSSHRVRTRHTSFCPVFRISICHDVLHSSQRPLSRGVVVVSERYLLIRP